MNVIRPWYSNSNHPRKEDFINIYNENNYNNNPQKIFVEGKREKIFKLLNIFPLKVKFRIIGILHSNIYPCFKKICYIWINKKEH